MTGTVPGVETTLHLPSPVTRTFLIADVRGYTSFTNEYGIAAAARLADRFAVLCKAVVSHYTGEVIELRGDEALAVFSAPGDAIRAAIALQARFQEESAADPSTPLRVGMGIETGPAVPLQGGYRGRALNLAARLCSLAGPAEVFTTEAVVEHARRIEGLAYVDRGSVQLKGFPDLVRVIHILPEDALPEHFPPLVSLVARPHNLPPQPTPFIGRNRERAEIAALLGREDVRLLTLSGPGGSGKTRLALQAGADVLDRFDRGVYFVNLASVADPSLVAATIAGTLRLKEDPSRPILQTLIAYLQEKHLLLVLDNFEHLLAARETLAELLATCPRVTLLVTSRAVLQLAAEHVYHVRPLPVPDVRHLPDLDTLTQYDAVALFIQRAQAARADFAVTNDNAPAVAEICARLDGLPLAIELAAARIKLFPPQALLQRLSSRLKLLTGGPADRPARQQTLRGALDWSFSLLSAEEQQLFTRLSVFAGGCTLEAAEAVCNPDGTLDVLELIASLVDKSLVREDSSGIPAEADGRFVMLETVREYAAEALQAREVIQDAHLAHYLALAEEAVTYLEGPEQVAWLNRLETEHDNCRAALRWGIERGVADDAARLAVALSLFWRIHGHLADAEKWLTGVRTLEAALRPDRRAGVLLELGQVVALFASVAGARSLFKESLALYREAGDPLGSALALLWLGNSLSPSDEPRSRVLREDSLAALRQVEYAPGIAEALWTLGANESGGGNDYRRRRRPMLEEALAIRRRLGDRRGTADVLISLATCDLNLFPSALRTVESMLQEALAIARDIGDRRLEAVALESLAFTHVHQDDLPAALSLLQESLSVLEEIGARTSVSRLNLSAAALDMGDLELAERYSAEALRDYAAPTRGRAILLYHLATIRLFTGDAAAARSCLIEGFECLAGKGETTLHFDLLHVAAGVAALEGRPETAVRLLGAAAALDQRLGVPGGPAERARRRQIAETIQRQIDEGAWTRAIAEGRELTLEQAVAAACETQDRPGNASGRS